MIAKRSPERRRLFYCIDSYVNTAYYPLVKAWSAAEIRARYPDLVVHETSIEDMPREEVLTMIDRPPEAIESLMRNAVDLDDVEAAFLVGYDRNRDHWRGAGDHYGTRHSVAKQGARASTGGSCVPRHYWWACRAE